MNQKIGGALMTKKYKKENDYFYQRNLFFNNNKIKYLKYITREICFFGTASPHESQEAIHPAKLME